MIITDEYTSEYVYNNIKLKETRNIVENTLLEYERKYGANCYGSVKVECVAIFMDKINNESKTITIERYNIIGELNKISQSSKGMSKFIRVIELKIMKQGRNYKNDSNAYLGWSNIPILWRKYYLKIAHDGGCK